MIAATIAGSVGKWPVWRHKNMSKKEECKEKLERKLAAKYQNSFLWRHHTGQFPTLPITATASDANTKVDLVADCDIDL